MHRINVIRKYFYTATIAGCTSQLDDSHGPEQLLEDNDSFWSSGKNNSIIPEHVTLDLREQQAVNYIEIYPSSNGKTTFPTDFRIEYSSNGTFWQVLCAESKFYFEEEEFYRLQTGLIHTRFIRVFITRPIKVGTRYFSELGQVRCGIAGAHTISASSTSSYEHETSMMLDDDPNSYWESEASSSTSRQSIDIDLGYVFSLNYISLLTPSVDINGFPEQFSIEVSADNNIWTPIIEEKRFRTEPATTYAWNTGIANARYIHIELNTTSIEKDTFAARIAGIGLFAASTEFTHTHTIGDITPNASIFQAGIVRLAKDGEDTNGCVVQGSDRRLRDATTIFKGIVQLAEDGMSREGLVAQSSDSRLKPATEIKHGIVRLAYDRENTHDAVVRGSDSRLLEATESGFGIVKICPDGLDSEQGVVRGNDSRLKYATSTSPGIVRLADNNEQSQGSVVQGNDKRLRQATTTYPGIVELAEDGEDAPDVAVQGNDRRLKDATTISRGIVELAEDGEDVPGVAVQGNDKRLKDATTTTKGIVELADNGENAPGVAVQGNDKRLKDATENETGILRFAADGETSLNAAVQGSDRRLKDATEQSTGIMRFATDGEDNPLAAVQGNDKRLRQATTTYPGIVELAENGEDEEGVAVQGNDRRLKDATTISKGIVELAEDGEDAPNVAVQGNDKRLKDATEKEKGILRFAHDGDTSPMAAVQGNDKRLRQATTTYPGIVELAENGEDEEGVAVQGNDRRLKDATTISKGIVELAEDGEDTPGVVVQGNDRRLKNATIIAPGIVQLAENCQAAKGLAVQADDTRLHDQRDPLPHTHDYASLEHEHNSHTGTLAITSNNAVQISGIVPPSSDCTPVWAKNTSSDSGGAGIVGISLPPEEAGGQSYGVIGHGRFTGIRGQSQGVEHGSPRGCGIIGTSRFGAGGVFSSEHDYSLVVDGHGEINEYDDTFNLIGDGKALKVHGTSEFSGTIHLKSSIDGHEFPANIVENFVVDDVEYISPGDLLVISEEGNSVLTRARTPYNRAVIGVVAGNPVMSIDNTRQEQPVYPLAITGKVFCKVDARQKPVRPGDLIVTSSTPGCGMVGVIDSFEKIGTVIGKALDSLEDGIGLIPVFISHK